MIVWKIFFEVCGGLVWVLGFSVLFAVVSDSDFQRWVRIVSGIAAFLMLAIALTAELYFLGLRSIQ